MDRDAARDDPGGDRGAAAGPAGAPLHGRAPSSTRMHVEQDGRPAAEPVRRLARSAGAAGADLLPAGQRPGRSSTGSSGPARATARVYVPAPRGGRRGPRRGGHAAGHLLRVQPGRLRPQRAVAPGSPASADRRRARRSGSANAPTTRAAWVDEDDLVTLGYYELPRGLTAGVAAHHAGMLPVFKETVEELFEAGPREGGLRHRDAVARDQHAGQDGRHRGPVEVLGRAARAADAGRVHAADRAGRAGAASTRSATRWCSTSGRCPFERVAGLASTRTYDLRSSFRPSYNMAVNLVRNYTREQAHHLLNSSFAQFLADRGVVALERAARTGPRVARGLPGRTCAVTGATSTSTGGWSSGRASSGRRTGGARERRGRTRSRGAWPPCARARSSTFPRPKRRGLAVVAVDARRPPTRAVAGPVVLPAVGRATSTSRRRS